MDGPDDPTGNHWRASVAVGCRPWTEDERLLTGFVPAGGGVRVGPAAPLEGMPRGRGRAFPASAQEEIGRGGSAVHLGEEEEGSSQDGEGE